MGKTAPLYTFEIVPSGDYGDFIERASRRFIKSFKHGLSHRTTEVCKKRSWTIGKKNMPKLRNIFIQTLEEEIAQKDLRTINSEKDKAIKELQEIINNAKDDIKYIKDEVIKKTAEEF